MKFIALKTDKGREVWFLGSDKKWHRELIPERFKNLNLDHAVSGKFHLEYDDSVVIDEYITFDVRDKYADQQILQGMEQTHKKILLLGKCR